jgi:hypothetical protein
VQLSTAPVLKGFLRRLLFYEVYDIRRIHPL